MPYEQQYCHDKGDVDKVKAVLDSKRGLIWEKKKAFVIRLRVCRRLPPEGPGPFPPRAGGQCERDERT